MRARIGRRVRRTSETSVWMELNLDGKGRYQVKTTLPFLDHMLELFARHGNFDLKVKAKGDTHIDDHHLVEDIGIVLGETLAAALGKKRGIVRYGQGLRPDLTETQVARWVGHPLRNTRGASHRRALGTSGAPEERKLHWKDWPRGLGRALTPMDETLSYVALDLSGRPYFDFKVKFRPQSKAPFCFELFDDFFQAVAFNAKMNLHIKLLQGRNNHHMAESIFKGFARALSQAVTVDPRRPARAPSTKGTL